MPYAKPVKNDGKWLCQMAQKIPYLEVGIDDATGTFSSQASEGMTHDMCFL